MTKTMAWVLGGGAALGLVFSVQGAQQAMSGERPERVVTVGNQASSANQPKERNIQPITIEPKSAAPRSGTDAERLAFVDSDPKLKAAEKSIALLINLNGHLCARVLEVSEAGGDLFNVRCVEKRNGTGRVRYLFDSSNKTATPI